MQTQLALPPTGVPCCQLSSVRQQASLGRLRPSLFSGRAAAPMQSPTRCSAATLEAPPADAAEAAPAADESSATEAVEDYISRAPPLRTEKRRSRRFKDMQAKVPLKTTALGEAPSFAGFSNKLLLHGLTAARTLKAENICHDNLPLKLVARVSVPSIQSLCHSHCANLCLTLYVTSDELVHNSLFLPCALRDQNSMFLAACVSNAPTCATVAVCEPIIKVIACNSKQWTSLLDVARIY